MKRIARACLLVLSLATPAFADTPAMGPYGSWVVGGPEITSPVVAAATLRMDQYSKDDWARKGMQAAGICVLYFLHDGSGIRVGIQVQGGCAIGPVISFPEFRRRMETP